MLKRLTFVLVAIAMTVSAPASTAGTSRESLPAPVPPVSEMLRFRASMGLDATESHVRAVANRYAWDSTIDDAYGVPLLPEEAAEIDRRVQIQEGLAPLRDLLRADPDSYGGHYIDHDSGGTVVVQIVGSSGPSDAAIRDVLPDGAELRIEHVRYTSAELLELTDTVTGDWDLLRDLGIEVASTALSGRDNVVQVGVNRPTAEEVAAIESRFGTDRVQVIHEEVVAEQHGCISTDHCAYPMRGGVWVSGCTAVPSCGGGVTRSF